MKKSILMILLLVGVAKGFAQVPSYAPSNGLVAWWPFTGNAKDSSGNGNHGTVNGATLTTDRFGKSNSAYSFDGVNDYINVPYSSTLGIQKYFTSSVWIYMDGGSCNPRVYEIHENLNCGGYTLGFNGASSGSRTFHTGQFGSCTTSNGITGSVSAVSTHSWHHIAIVIDGVNAIGKLYIDGNLTYTTTGNVIPIINYYGAALCIGNIAPNRCDWWGGKIDDFGLWNRALSACEIAGLYQSKVVTPKPATVSIGSDTQRYCGKDSVKISATSGFKSYVWSNGKIGGSIHAKSTGMYTVTATDSQGCVVNDTAVISILNPKISPRDTVVCNISKQDLSITNVTFSGSCGTIQSGLKSGMTAWYPFCGNANDQVGSNNGTPNGAVLSNGDLNIPNTAYSFNGSNSYIGLSQPFLGGGQVSEFTIRTKVKFNTLSNVRNIWGKTFFWGEVNWGVSDGSIYLVWANTITGNKYSSIFTDTQKVKLKTGIWYDLVVAFKNSKGTIYVNGIAVPTNLQWVAQGGAILSTTQVEASCNFQQDAGSSRFGFRVVGGSWVDYLNGSIDEFNVWNRALSASEISGVYTQQSVGSGKYSWSTSDTTQTTKITQTGKSSVWVKVSNGIGTCYDTTTVRIQRPIVSIGKDTQRYCGADSVKLTASSGFASYSWSNRKKGASVYTNATGAIQVTAIDSFGCSAQDTALISILNPRITPRDTIVCSGQAVTLRIKDTSSAAPACATLPTSLKTGLVGWWPFCGNANDESGNGNHGKVNGASLTTDRFGNSNKAYDFNGLTSYIVGNISNFNNTSITTLAAWIYYTGDAGGQPYDLFFEYGSYGSHTFAYGYNYKNQNIDFYSQCFWNPYTKVNLTNAWHHVVIVDSLEKTKIYIDGKILTGFAWGGASNCYQGSNQFFIGGGCDNQFTTGKIDDIGIWKRALTQQEVSTLYNLNNIKLTSSWSTGDTLSNTIIKTAGTTPVWLRQTNGIGTCYDTVTVGISNPKVDFAADTLRLLNCNRDSLNVSVGKGWKSVAWSTGTTDSSTSLKSTGEYSVKVQDNVGCYAYDTTYFINPGKVKVTVLLVDSVNCYNGSDGSINTSQTGGFAPVTLAWNDPAKQTTNKATGLKAGSYKLMASDAYGCKDSVTVAVQQPAKLTVTLSSIDSVRCYRYTDGSLTVTATGGTVPYAYGWNTGATTSKLDNLGSGVYKVVVQDGNGCKDSLTASLQDPPELIARIVSGTMAMKSEKLAVSGVASPAGNHTYSWQPASLFGTMASSLNASITVEKNVTLRLTVTNKKGCIANDSLDVTVVQALKDIMPNAFSPNTDGLNEGFGLPDIFEISEFYVYDRWGGIIFSGSESTPRWNGLIGSEAAPAGSYSYHIVARLKGGIQEFQYSGKVALIK